MGALIQPLTAKDLPQDTAGKLVELGYVTADCQSHEGLHRILKCLHEIFPIDGVVGGTGHIEGVSSLSEVWAKPTVPVIKLGPVSQHNWPAEFLSNYFKANLIRRDAQLYAWFRTFRPQLWVDLYAKQRYQFDPRTKRGFDPSFVEMIFDYRLSHSVRFGQIDNPSQIGGLVVNFRSRREALKFSPLLQAFLPYFHRALLRVNGLINYEQVGTIASLTPREREVLKWLTEGKSNWDISTVLGIAERTVKFHIQNLMRKLAATNRCQLVANAFGSEINSLFH